MSFELAAKTIDKVSTDVGKNNKFNPDKRAEKVDIKNRETGKRFDPDKRAEKTEIKENIQVERKRLSDADKKIISEKTGWSSDILENIGSMEEAKIYIEAGLKEVEINGKKCLIQKDIDWNKTDDFGRTNKERSQIGLAPLDKNGNPMELHHIGQKADSPLAELTQEQHRGKGNDSVLHDKTKESEIDRHAFASERAKHWATRISE